MAETQTYAMHEISQLPGAIRTLNSRKFSIE